MSVKIYRATDRITLKIGELVFKLAPLSYYQKMELAQLGQVKGGEVIRNHRDATIKAVQYSVKAVEGLETCDDRPYELDFDSNGILTDTCVNELLNIEMSDKLIFSCFNMLEGLPSKIKNPATGKVVKGVEIVKNEGKQIG